MIVLSHRGFWLNQAEKNSLVAFERSFSLGIGVETDIRDWDGRLVISHDLPNCDSIPFENFISLYLQYPLRPILALNIKADGLQNELEGILNKFDVKNYFLFDMAVPDGLLYIKRGLNTFTRHSEYEPVPPYYAMAQGVWLDEFESHWLTDETIKKHLSMGKAICIVSPELHNRPFEKEWAHYRELEKEIGTDRLILCTDLPERAKEFFNAEN